MSELLSCPFCGGEAEYYFYPEERDIYDSDTLGFVDTYEVTVHCVECKECPLVVGPFSSKEAAIEVWNTRAYEEKNDDDE